MRCSTIVAFGLVLALSTAGVITSEPRTFGAGVTLTEPTPIAQIVDRPAAFEGKTVRVEGVVTAVCAQMGCWMALAPADTPKGPAVRLKVDDGVIVFPVSAKGRRAAAQGVVERIDAGDAEANEAAAEHARQVGQSAAHAAKPWQIKATGAVVY